jgi:hypothetical protein
MFLRNPTGMLSQSVKEAGDAEARLRLLDNRLNAKGWSMLRDPEFPAERLGDPRLRSLQTQLLHLQALRGGLRRMQDIAALAKFYTLKEDWANEANARAMMTQYAQALMLGIQIAGKPSTKPSICSVKSTKRRRNSGCRHLQRRF